MKTRKRKEKKKQKKKNPVAGKPASFPATAVFRGTHAKRRPQHAHPQPNIFRIPAKGEKRENFERERDFGQTSASVQFLRRALKPPLNRHQTTCYYRKRDP